MALTRLDKLLSDMGIATRSELKKIIRSGRVSVDGVAAAAPDMKIDSAVVSLCLDGQPLIAAKAYYYMMDKPCGVLTATADKKQKTVLDLVTEQMRRQGIFPVGRLDKDTSGLLLLTNDGIYAHRVISPKSGVEKRYYARVDGMPDEADVTAFKAGLVLSDGTRCLPAVLELLGGDKCAVTVTEGKYHQVRRMLASRGKTVLELRRLSAGGLSLDESLGAGGFRELSQEEADSVLMAK